MLWEGQTVLIKMIQKWNNAGFFFFVFLQIEHICQPNTAKHATWTEPQSMTVILLVILFLLFFFLTSNGLGQFILEQFKCSIYIPTPVLGRNVKWIHFCLKSWMINVTKGMFTVAWISFFITILSYIYIWATLLSDVSFKWNCFIFILCIILLNHF